MAPRAAAAAARPPAAAASRRSALGSVRGEEAQNTSDDQKDFTAALPARRIWHLHRQRVCGHDPLLWHEPFPAAVAWAFARA